VKSAVSSIIGNRKGTSGSGHGSVGGAMAGTSHKSGGGGKLLKKVGKVAVVGLAGKTSGLILTMLYFQTFICLTLKKCWSKNDNWFEFVKV
jgi:hypothetical protein